jgi:hypothetical protein
VLFAPCLCSHTGSSANVIDQRPHALVIGTVQAQSERSPPAARWFGGSFKCVQVFRLLAVEIFGARKIARDPICSC